MQIKEVMTHSVVTIPPNSTLQEAAKKMKDLDIGALPVSENGRLIGVLTDRDITVRSVSDAHEQSDKVRDVMTSEVISCFEDQDVSEGAQLMKQKQIRRLVVLNSEGQPVGILSLGDLALESEALAASILHRVAEPGRK
jgi:CBS domain-containing protein